jgi:choline-sulfatase
MERKDHRPNVIVIMSDDQGPWAMGCAGTPELDTPALDRIASEGMRFENCFCASPVCSPARASFLTGRIPSSHGIHDWIKSGNINVDEGVTWSGKDRPIEYLAGLPAFTDVLADNGYLVGLSGKWHLGDSGRPQKSHDYWCAHSLGGDSYTDYHIFDDDETLAHQSQYVTDLFTDRAIDFIDAHAADDQPFCLSIHYTAPHAPWREHEQPPEIWQRYAGQEFPSLPVLPPHPWGGWDPTPEQRSETIGGYFTTITAMDTAIGRVLDQLDALGIADNTLLVFTSDNGYSVGHHGVLGKGNGTYPMNMYEEAVKVPFLARCPGRVPAGIVNDALVSHYDFLPTLLDFLGIENPIKGLPGRSFAGSLAGGTHEDGSIVIEEPASCVYEEYGPVRMIRDREWKYVHRYPDGPHELYHLAEDPLEEVNLINNDSASTTLERLRTELGEWFSRYEDPARDGSRLPVTGQGQVQMVAPDENSEAFV